MAQHKPPPCKRLRTIRKNRRNLHSNRYDKAYDKEASKVPSILKQTLRMDEISFWFGLNTDNSVLVCLGLNKSKKVCPGLNYYMIKRPNASPGLSGSISACRFAGWVEEVGPPLPDRTQAPYPLPHLGTRGLIRIRDAQRGFERMTTREKSFRGSCGKLWSCLHWKFALPGNNLDRKLTIASA